MIHTRQWNNGKMFHENCFNKKLLLLFHLSLGAKIEKKCLWQVSTMFGVGLEKDFTLTKVNVFVDFFHALLTETFIFNIYSFLVRLWRTMLRINEIKTKDESNLLNIFKVKCKNALKIMIRNGILMKTINHWQKWFKCNNAKLLFGKVRLRNSPFWVCINESQRLD